MPADPKTNNSVRLRWQFDHPMVHRHTRVRNPAMTGELVLGAPTAPRTSKLNTTHPEPELADACVPPVDINNLA